MKILFLLGDYGKKSVERQLAEVAEELIGKDAEIVWHEENTPLANYRELDGVWIFTHEEDGGCPEELTNLIKEGVTALEDVPITFSGIGGKDGAMNALTELLELLQSMDCRVMDEEDPVVTQIPLRSARFDIDRDERMDLFWQVDAFIKYCGMDDSESRKIAFESVVNNYFKLMKYLSPNGERPTELAFEDAEIVTDVGRFDCVNLGEAPAEISELHYEIEALTADYEIEEEEILSALLEKILREW